LRDISTGKDIYLKNFKYCEIPHRARITPWRSWNIERYPLGKDMLRALNIEGYNLRARIAPGRSLDIEGYPIGQG
jgi:hypothetical protein